MNLVHKQLVNISEKPLSKINLLRMLFSQHHAYWNNLKDHDIFLCGYITSFLTEFPSLPLSLFVSNLGYTFPPPPVMLFRIAAQRKYISEQLFCKTSVNNCSCKICKICKIYLSKIYVLCSYLFLFLYYKLIRKLKLYSINYNSDISNIGIVLVIYFCRFLANFSQKKKSFHSFIHSFIHQFVVSHYFYL